MPKKLTQEYVRQLFVDKGWTLKDNYINSKTKMRFICNQGHEHAITVDKLTQGKGCVYCSGKVRHEYNYIASYFEKEGYILLSEIYINNKQKLCYVCPEGHQHSITWSDFKHGGYRCPSCAVTNSRGINSGMWRGGVTKLNLPLYSTYAPQLEKYQPVYKIEQASLELLGVECTFCKKVFVPSGAQVRNRLKAIAGNVRSGDANLYCSGGCKELCPIHGQRIRYKGEKNTDNQRPDQNAWAAMVKERDNYTCQICGAIDEQLIAHHIDPVINNPIESMDIDNGITLCKSCDSEAHKIPGCGYNELRCKTG